MKQLSLPILLLSTLSLFAQTVVTSYEQDFDWKVDTAFWTTIAFWYSETPTGAESMQ